MCFTDIKNNLTTVSRTSSVKTPFTKIKAAIISSLKHSVKSLVKTSVCSCKKKKKKLFKCVSILHRLLNTCKQKSKNVSGFTKLFSYFQYAHHLNLSVWLVPPASPYDLLTLCILCVCQMQLFIVFLHPSSLHSYRDCRFQCCPFGPSRQGGPVWQRAPLTSPRKASPPGHRWKCPCLFRTQIVQDKRKYNICKLTK